MDELKSLVLGECEACGIVELTYIGSMVTDEDLILYPRLMEYKHVSLYNCGGCDNTMAIREKRRKDRGGEIR